MTEIFNNKESKPEAMTKEQAFAYMLRVFANFKDKEENLNEETKRHFIFTYVFWISEMFKDPNGQRQNVSFEGAKAPDDIKSLLTWVSNNTAGYSDENTVHLKTVTDFIYSPAVIPKFDEILNEKGINYLSIVDRIANDPDILQETTGPEIAYEPTVVMRFNAGGGRGWGLEYVVKLDSISVFVFGKEGHTREASKYAVETSQDMDSLQDVVLGLSLLYAKGHPIAKSDMTMTEAEEHFKAWLCGDESFPFDDVSERIHYTLQDSVYDKLIARGAI